MSDVPVPLVTSCSNCGVALPREHRFCTSCGLARGAAAVPERAIGAADPAPPTPPSLVAPVAPARVVPVVAIAPKSAGLAVFLTFLWLGAGHLYVNRITSGIILLVVDLVLWFLMWTLIGALFAFPVWLILFVIAAIRVSGHVTEYNRRLFAH